MEILANDQLESMPPLPQVRQVYLANEAKFTSSFLSRPLTDWAGGFADPEGIRATLDFVAPWVPVEGQRFEYNVFDAAAALVAEGNDVRPLGADFQRVDIPGTMTQGKALNKGLTVRIDVDAFGASERARQAVVAQLLAILWRNDLRRAIAAMDGAATSTVKTWDTGAVGDPDADVIEELEDGDDSAGLPLNRVLYGGTAWKKRVMSLRSKKEAGSIAGAMAGESQLALLFGVTQVLVSRERRQTSSSAKTQMVGSAVYCFNAKDLAGPQDPSHLKRFVILPDGKNLYRVYEQRVSSNLVDITVEHYSDVVVTSSSGIRKLSIS